jgi:hypothetical protein
LEVNQRVLEHADEGDVRQRESQHEQAASAVDPPARELVAGHVERAAEEEEEPHVAELRHQREEDENRPLGEPVEHLGDSDAASVREHVQSADASRC